MPLVAVVDGQRVTSLNLDDATWDQLRRWSRQDEKVLLPGCGAPAYLRTSRAGLRHFAHKPGADVCTSHAPESTLHLRAKAAIVQAARSAGWHAEPELPGNGYVADVLAWEGDRKVAFEVQLSKQADTDHRDRTMVRLGDGAQVVWLVKARKPRSAWDPPDPLTVPNPTMPVAQLAVDDHDILVVDLAGPRMPLEEFVPEFLAERLTPRTHVTGPVGLRVELLRYACYACHGHSTVWEVTDRVVTGPCGTAVEEGVRHMIWAPERSENAEPVKAAVARQVHELGWPRPAGMSMRHSQTARASYMAFSCPHCGALFGDFYLRDEWMEARMERWTQQVTVPTVDNRMPHPHWCRDIGAGVCAQP